MRNSDPERRQGINTLTIPTIDPTGHRDSSGFVGKIITMMRLIEGSLVEERLANNAERITNRNTTRIQGYEGDD